MTGRIATLSLLTAATLLSGCGKSADSFSLLSDGSTYKQNAAYVQRKVDVLWVIDNSGSMQTSQDNLAANFKSFIQRFKDKDTDYRMAVITTDAYLAPYYFEGSTNQPRNSLARFKPGRDLSNRLYYVMDKNTPDLENVFLTAVRQGTSGAGDERAFSSFKESLSNSVNTGFYRPGAVLSVIIVSDEDDFSHNDLSDDPSQPLKNYYFTENYSDPKMYTVQSYVDYLTAFTNGGVAGKDFSVNSISAMDDQNCANQLGTKKAPRYLQLTNATKGVAASLCSAFGQTLDIISESLVKLTTEFQLTRIPNPDTIVVTVDGVVMPNDPVSGWTYDSVRNSISFQNAPPAGSSVSITFDPAGVKN